MAIQGDDFLKNVQLKQEEESLKQKISEFGINREENIENGNMDKQSNFANTNTSLKSVESLYNLHLEPEPTTAKNTENERNEVDDFLYQKNLEQKSQNKKKYLMLGISLVLLFIISIIIIGMLSGDNNSLKQDEQTISQDAVLNQKIQQEYQEIKENTEQKKLEDEAFKMPPSAENYSANSQETKTVETPKQVEQVVVEQPKPKATPKPVDVEKKPEPKPEPKPVQKKEIKELFKTPDQGWYIQIGSYFNGPNKTLLKRISDNKLKYKMYDTVVKNRKITRLVVGPYKTKLEANNALQNVKNIARTPNAFVNQIKN